MVGKHLEKKGTKPHAVWEADKLWDNKMLVHYGWGYKTEATIHSVQLSGNTISTVYDKADKARKCYC